MTSFNADQLDLSDLPAEVENYTVALRNAGVEVIDEVVLFHQQGADVVFAGATHFQPGDRVVFPLGPPATMAGYVVGCFVGTAMVARIPPGEGTMDAARAASLDPARPNAFTDAWAIDATSLLPLDQVRYKVVVANHTTDTWSEVALFYRPKGGLTEGISIPDVPPGDTATFELCTCDQLDGYTFAVFVDDVAQYLDETPDGQPSTAFPAVGLMNARRSLDYHDDFDPCGDLWTLTWEGG